MSACLSGINLLIEYIRERNKTFYRVSSELGLSNWEIQMLKTKLTRIVQQNLDEAMERWEQETRFVEVVNIYENCDTSMYQACEESNIPSFKLDQLFPSFTGEFVFLLFTEDSVQVSFTSRRNPIKIWKRSHPLEWQPSPFTKLLKDDGCVNQSGIDNWSQNIVHTHMQHPNANLSIWIHSSPELHRVYMKVLAIENYRHENYHRDIQNTKAKLGPHYNALDHGHRYEYYRARERALYTTRDDSGYEEISSGTDQFVQCTGDGSRVDGQDGSQDEIQDGSQDEIQDGSRDEIQDGSQDEMHGDYQDDQLTEKEEGELYDDIEIIEVERAEKSDIQTITTNKQQEQDDYETDPRECMVRIRDSLQRISKQINESRAKELNRLGSEITKKEEEITRIKNMQKQDRIRELCFQDSSDSDDDRSTVAAVDHAYSPTLGPEIKDEIEIANFSPISPLSPLSVSGSASGTQPDYQDTTDVTTLGPAAPIPENVDHEATKADANKNNLEKELRRKFNLKRKALVLVKNVSTSTNSENNMEADGNKLKFHTKKARASQDAQTNTNLE